MRVPWLIGSVQPEEASAFARRDPGDGGRQTITAFLRGQVSCRDRWGCCRSPLHNTECLAVKAVATAQLQRCWERQRWAADDACEKGPAGVNGGCDSWQWQWEWRAWQREKAKVIGAAGRGAAPAGTTCVAHSLTLPVCYRCCFCHPVYTSSSQCKHTAKTQPHRIGLHAADYSSVMICVQWPLTRRTMLTPQQAMAVASPRAEKASHCRLGWTRQ